MDYVARVNRAIDHIRADLTAPLALEDVARVAHFSPFHFHRVWKAVVGETLATFVKRLRLERALQLMSHRPAASLTDIALASGFASSSDFSRSFKQRYGVPPRAFDLRGFRDDTRAEFVPIARLPAGANPDRFVATLHRLPSRFVAYLRVSSSFGPGAVPAAAARLVAWAERRGLADGAWLGYMWDDPEVVARAHCRYDVGVVIPERIAPDGDIGCVAFPAMTVARVEVRGDIGVELRAFDWLYTTWLPRSGLVPDDQPLFEAWRGRPFAHGDAHFELAAELPVVDDAPLG